MLHMGTRRGGMDRSTSLGLGDIWVVGWVMRREGVVVLYNA